MKKILLSLFVGLIGIISFCNAGTINGSSSSFAPGSTITTVKGYCYRITNTSYNIKFYDNNNNYLGNIGSQTKLFCNPADGYVKNEDTITTYLYTYNITNFTGNCSNSDCPVCPTCPDPYTSLECQTEYNLIPIEDIDINYCVLNGLCPNESGTGDFSGDLQFSNIYINNILHPGRQNIFVTIPDYITWDYAFTGDDFSIYVGSGYDEEYINSIIKINSYRPTTTDFSDIFISGLTLIFPYIVVTLFIVFVWRLLKRIFK